MAIDKCTYETAVEIAQQIYPTVDVATISNENLLGRFPTAEYSFREVNGLKLPLLDNTLRSGERTGLIAYYQNARDLSFKGGDDVNGYLVVDSQAYSGEPTKTASRAPWPQFSFDLVVRDLGTDVFGSPIGSYRVAQNLRIVKPKLAETEVKFENITSGRPTQFTANPDRYVNCLLTEIGR